MLSQSKLISIVVTAYNVSSYIEECINSILQQTYQNFELIIVEDCSTDDTLSIINKFDDSRIRVIRNKENVGAGLSRRIGIKACKGEYISLIDGDDYVLPIYLEYLLDKAETNSADIAVISCFTDSGEVLSIPKNTFEGRDTMKYLLGIRRHVVFLNTMLVKKWIWDKIDYCDRRYIEDTPNLVYLLHYANKIVCENTPLYMYRYRKDSLTNSSNIYKDAVFSALASIDTRDAFEKFGYVFDEEESMRILKVTIYLSSLQSEEEQNKYKKEIDIIKNKYIEYSKESK